MRYLGKILNPWILMAYLAVGIFFFFAVYLGRIPISHAGEQAGGVSGTNYYRVSRGRSLLITAHIMTAGDPNEFGTELHSSQIVWVTSWLLHIMSWVGIPSVVGYVVGREVARASRSTFHLKYYQALSTLADKRGLTGKNRRDFIRDGMRLLNEQTPRS